MGLTKVMHLFAHAVPFTYSVFLRDSHDRDSSKSIIYYAESLKPHIADGSLLKKNCGHTLILAQPVVNFSESICDKWG